MKPFFFAFIIVCLSLTCSRLKVKTSPLPTQAIVVLGIAQDAGYPQIHCQRECCRRAWQNPARRQLVSCLGLIDQNQAQSWIFDATPDLKQQVQALQKLQGKSHLPTGIFLTHAHMGHYTGLMELGREALNATKIPVFAMPRMKAYLEQNGPWSQLVSLKNIDLQPLIAGQTHVLNNNLKVRPLLVPHRDEYSETVGYEIMGPRKKLLFIPDIDKWHKWDQDLKALLQNVDYALIDGTFLKNGEIFGRNMAEIPHPFIQESMDLLKDLPLAMRQKVFFMHFNHTNPVLFSGKARREVEKAGFGLAWEGMVLGM
jgi:pyrroloquinoline quinone biosynthesis protein B